MFLSVKVFHNLRQWIAKTTADSAPTSEHVKCIEMTQRTNTHDLLYNAYREGPERNNIDYFDDTSRTMFDLFYNDSTLATRCGHMRKKERLPGCPSQLYVCVFFSCAASVMTRGALRTIEKFPPETQCRSRTQNFGLFETTVQEQDNLLKTSLPSPTSQERRAHNTWTCSCTIVGR